VEDIKATVPRKNTEVGGGDIEDRHYSPTEYLQLNDGRKAKLKALRIARGDSGNEKDTWQAAQLLTRISKLEAMVSQEDAFSKRRIRQMIEMRATQIAITRL
jgi:hypothetical protein